MKWIKNRNQLINMAHVETISIRTNPAQIVFYGEGCDRLIILDFETLESAEKELENIAMFLEHSNSVVMAMAPTNEEAL